MPEEEETLDAYMVFDKSKHDSISWKNCGYSSHVGNCIEKMYLENISVDCGIYAAVLKACSSIYVLDEGQKIHREILLKGYEKDLFVGSSLVDLYAKCGAAHEAWIIFKGLSARDDVLWNVLLSGYVDNGFSQEALMCLHIMQLVNQAPSVATLAHLESMWRFRSCR